MTLYLLKSIACLLLLLLVHRVLLQREVLHRFNRFFLLFSVVASFLIPLYTIEVPQEIASSTTEVISKPFDFEAISQDINQDQVFAAVPESQFNWEYLLFGLYGLISLVFLYRFVRNIKVLVNKIQRNVKINYRGQTLVLLQDESLPFSFLEYIFVAESDLESGKFTDAVFAHECTHIKEKHSWDNLFIEALLVPLWFHPGLHWAKASIKLNHEFIADQIALRSTPLEKYESQLLAMMLSKQKYGLASSLNFSLTKKRFEMMKRKSKNLNTWIKVIALVPVLGALVYFFSERVTAQADATTNESEVFVNTANQKYLEPMDFDLTFTLKPDGFIQYENDNYDLNEVKELISETKNSQGDVKINLITDSELSMGELSDFQTVLRDLDIRRVHYVSSNQDGNDKSKGKYGEEDYYHIVHQGQVNGSIADDPEGKEKYYRNASIFVEDASGNLDPKSYAELSEDEKAMLHNPPKAPKRNRPSTDVFESWKNKEDFALWLDGKVIPNSQLEELSVTEIAFFHDSFVHTNARSERFPQEHQVSIYTEDAYERTYGSKSNFGKPMTEANKLYIYPRDKRVNNGKPWVKKEKESVADQKEETADKWPPRVRSAEEQDNIQSYNDVMLVYEKLRRQAPHFVKRSREDQEMLTEMFSDLRSMYQHMSFFDKAKFCQPAQPFAPYLKLESDGEVYYKMGRDLTAEELKKYPPPPPPPATHEEQVEAYKKVFYQYELMRNKGRNDASLSMVERNTLFLLYNELQMKFLSMGASERRQVKMVNFPYYRVEENGKKVFKAVSELTPEQRALNNC